ncbi:hypothetical protein ABPG75_005709 [Micractinium tetrahymenae]
MRSAGPLLLLAILTVRSSAMGCAASTAGGRPAGRRLAQGSAADAAAPPTSADVIVVGAGLAGTAAAHDLAKQGLKVILLEARSRIGGRTWTQELPAAGGKKVRVEMGAAWVHGLVNNPIVTLAKQAGVSLAARVTDYENAVVYLPNGKEASAAQETRWEGLFSDFEDAIASEQAANEESGRDPGIGAVLTRFIADEELAGMDRLALLFLANTNIEQEYAAPLAKLSLYYDSDTALDGDDKFVTGGYQRLAEFLARGLDVRLGHKVTAIDSSKPGSITVSVEGKAPLTAQRVVVAVPLGVLQKGAIRFLPSGLPAANRAALGQLGMGLLSKLFLVFDRPWWTDVKNIEVWNRISAGGSGAWQETYNLWPITGQPVLVAFNAANYAEQLEKKSKQAVKDEFMAVLRSIFGAKAVPEPVSYEVTTWGSDPFAYGSYSYAKAPLDGEEGYNRAHLDCAKPMAGNRIFFAGEHTRTDYPATTHGALLSGQKAARDLLKVLPGFAAAAQGAGPCDIVEGAPAGSNDTACGGTGMRGRRRRLR